MPSKQCKIPRRLRILGAADRIPYTRRHGSNSGWASLAERSVADGSCRPNCGHFSHSRMSRLGYFHLISLAHRLLHGPRYPSKLRTEEKRMAPQHVREADEVLRRVQGE